MKTIKAIRVLLVTWTACLCLTGFSQTTNTAKLRVAVFVENGFPGYGDMPTLPASKMVELLAQHDIQAQALSAAELSDPAILNVHRITTLVMPYGNAFPKPAFTNLQAFHAAGGCLVMNGIPFCHPCDKVNGKWQDLGDADSLGLNYTRSIGTGGFGGLVAANKNPRAFIPGHPLFLNESMLPDDDIWSRRQWLDPHTLDSRDDVIPLVNIGTVGEQYPGAALIRHHDVRFLGARDVWMGTVAAGRGAADLYLAEQLLLRGVLWCELEKGELGSAFFTARLAELDRISKPMPLPGNLPFVVTPRPWGDTYLPKSNPPAQELLVVNAEELNGDERIALACLQGLTSRERPRIWINRGWIGTRDNRPYQDQTWLDWLKVKKGIYGCKVVVDWTSLFKQFAGSYKGAIIPDPNLYRGDLLAVNIAACEDLIVATPELARKLDLPVTIDLRGRFKTYAEGMSWIWATYKNQLSHHLCNYLHPSRLNNCAFAYDFQWRSVMFWIAGPVDEHNPGADFIAERLVMAQILAEMDPNVAVLGYPWEGEGVGLGEGGGVVFASRYAKGLIASDYVANTCVMSGVNIANMKQPPPPPPPPLDKNSVYIALALSDGDNLNIWMYWYKRYFNDPSFGKFPLAFGMGPAIRELMPSVAQWYYEHASPQTEFIADVSGVSYIQPDDYGSAFADRNRVLGGFLDWTARAMQSMGMTSVRTIQGSDDVLSQYSKVLPFCHSIFADYGRCLSRNGIDQLTYSLPGNMPVFRALMSGQDGKNGFLQQVREQVGSSHPAFVNGFISCWDFNPGGITQIYEQRDSNMVFVTPAHLAILYRQARDKGWIK